MVFDEVRQLSEEHLVLLLVAGAKGEELLELVDNEHRRDRLAVPSLQMKAVAMKKLQSVSSLSGNVGCEMRAAMIASVSAAFTWRMKAFAVGS